MDENRSLSDNQRRFFCRIVFLLACVLPTSFAVYFVFHRSGPSHWERLIQSRLPIKVDITSVETPIPNQVVLRGLRVLPSETGLFSELYGVAVDEVTIEFGVNENEVIFVHPIEMEMKTLANLLDRVVSDLDETMLGNDRWKFSFSKVALVDSGEGNNDFLMKPMSLVVEQGTSYINSNARAVHARLVARTGKGDPDKQLNMEFQKSVEGWLLTVDARQDSIPANLLQHFLEEVPLIGGSGQFQGQFDLLVDSDGRATGKISGKISDVHLDKFQLGSGELTGVCDIRILNCNIANGRIDSSDMQVVAEGPVTVTRQFLKEAAEFGIKDRLDLDLQSYRIAMVDLRVLFSDGNVVLVGSKVADPWDESRSVFDCIAFQSENGLLVPKVICNAKRSIPIGDVAKMVVGREGNRTYEFLNCFNVAERLAEGDRARMH